MHNVKRHIISPLCITGRIFRMQNAKKKTAKDCKTSSEKKKKNPAMTFQGLRMRETGNV